MNHLKLRNRRRKRITVAVSVILIAALIFMAGRSLVNTAYLKSDGVFVTGVVTGVSNNQRNTGSGVVYEFSVNGKQYKGSAGYPQLSTSFCESLIGRSFPVLYTPTNVNNNKMLLTKSTYDMYGRIQPDSLKWIEKYVAR